MDVPSSMSDQSLLSRISSDFDSTKCQKETNAIRVKIAEHVETLQGARNGSKPLAIPKHIQGYRKNYLQALRSNATAKAELSKLQDQTGSSPISSGESFTTSPLPSHLEVLKLRRQHHHYNVLSHHASEAETIASNHKVYSTETATYPTTNIHPQEQAEDISDLIAKAQDLTHNLEIALLQANHQLQQERHLLAELKSQVPTTPPSSEAKFHALSTTRAELTRWIENSLSECDTESPIHQFPIQETDQINPPDLNSQYNNYLQARAHFLKTLSNIISPPPPPPSLPVPTSSSPPPPPSNPYQHPYPNSQPTPLPSLLSTHLPHLTTHTITTQYETHLSTLHSQSNKFLLSSLHRLQDESHLLTSYPLLSAPRPQPPHKTRSEMEIELYDQHQHQHHQDRGREEIKLNSQRDEIQHLLSAWEFAREAAAISVEGVVDRRCREGESMVKEIMDLIENLKVQDRVWSEVGGG